MTNISECCGRSYAYFILYIFVFHICRRLAIKTMFSIRRKPQVPRSVPLPSRAEIGRPDAELEDHTWQASKWEPYETTNQSYLYISAKGFTLKQKFREVEAFVFNTLVPRLLQSPWQPLHPSNKNSTSGDNTWQVIRLHYGF